MTGKLGGRCRGVGRSAAGVAVAAGIAFGSAGIIHADPSTAPSPAPEPMTTPSAITTTTPKPTVAAEGGAAAGAAAAAAAGAGAAATGGDVLDQLAEEYATGAGGGQLSNLLRVSLKLRAMGYKPSKPYLDELQAAMKYRPNQLPLIDALKDTIAYQQKIKAQMDILTSAQGGNGMASGAGSAPGPGSPVSVVATPPAAPPPPPLP